mgnify:FL=1|tara:strand:+ start:839 stop:1063 length:225 start_codon:yes stop_codon:yes gene_type:complete
MKESNKLSPDESLWCDVMGVFSTLYAKVMQAKTQEELSELTIELTELTDLIEILSKCAEMISSEVAITSERTSI